MEKLAIINSFRKR